MFDPLHAATLRQVGFIVGTDCAIRIKYSVTYIIWLDGRWYASHFRNNVKLEGVASNPVKAYRQAKDALQDALVAGGSPRATEQT